MAEWHTVQQGECLSTIAKQHKFLNYRTIYEHPQNEALRRKRPNAHVLFPGDQIYIPDKKERRERCGTGRAHRFVLTKTRAEIRIIIKDADGKPVPGAPYELRLRDVVLEGTTDDTGLLRQDIPIGEQSAELHLPGQNMKWQLRIGHLDPVEDADRDYAIISGIQARLNNLGFHCGAADGVAGPKTKAALKRFQSEVLKRQDPDGEPDGDIRQALVREHHC
jgi:N-acetylmuramoyl-L-alanine amidase